MNQASTDHDPTALAYPKDEGGLRGLLDIFAKHTILRTLS